MAVKNYGWYWVNYWRGGSYNGQCYDVDDSTNYQVFCANCATYASTNSAINATWPWLARQSGAIFEASYIAGSYTCARINGYQMYQDGSYTCAQEGYVWQSIISTFYDNVTFGASLQQYVASGSNWSAYNDSAGTIAPDLEGRPTAVGNGGSIFAPSATTSDLIQYVGAPWTAYDISSRASGGGTVIGSPAFVAYNSTTSDVFVSSTSGDLMQYQAVSGSWSAYDLSASAWGGGQVLGSPTVTLSGASLDIYVRSASNQLMQYTNDNQHGTVWSAYPISSYAGQPGVADNPVAFGLGDVLVESTTGHLMQYVGAPWTAYDITNKAPGGGSITGAPDPIVYNSSTDDVLVRSSSGHLVQYQSVLGEWAFFDLSASAYGGVGISGSPSTAQSGSYLYIYAQSASSQLELFLNDSAHIGYIWSAYNVSTLAGQSGISGDPDAYSTTSIYVMGAT